MRATFQNKGKRLNADCIQLSFGMPDAIRTHGLQSRSLTLYPTELRAHIDLELNYYNISEDQK